MVPHTAEVRPRVNLEIGISRKCTKSLKEVTSDQEVRPRVYLETGMSRKCTTSLKEGTSAQEVRKKKSTKLVINL